MNVRIEDDSKEKKKLSIFYISIIAICIISIITAFIIQAITESKPQKNNGGNNNTVVELPKLTDDKISVYKAQFNEIFENKVNYLENNSYKISKIKEDEEIIYVGYKSNESKINDFELNVNIPYINIKSEDAEEFNKQIKDIFEKKAKSVLNTQNSNIIYTVDYSAYITNNILSLVIRSTLKEGGNAQRDIVQTYNNDLENHKKCNIDKMLELKGLTKEDANENIKKEIKTVQQKVEELSKLGYTIYSRDYTNDIYSINNATEYFIGENNALYIIYAYGNQNHTSEMDIVVM